MSKFPSVKPKKKEPVGIEVTGAFECHTCGEICLRAHIVRTEERMSWTCSEGHLSSIQTRI